MGAVNVRYSSALKTAPVKWANFMKRRGFSRARGHVSRTLFALLLHPLMTDSPFHAGWYAVLSLFVCSRADDRRLSSLETHYPLLFEYHRQLATSLAFVGLYFLFGAFASFCINSGDRVACLPHRDNHNLGSSPRRSSSPLTTNVFLFPGPGLCGASLPFSCALRPD
jgi:hypothetical protein